MFTALQIHFLITQTSSPQIRLMRQLVGFEDGDTVREEQVDAEGNIVEEEEDNVEEKESKKTADAEEEAGMEEEPKVAQLHAEWIHTLVRFGNRLFEEGNSAHATLILRHALFLFEMLEKGVVEPQIVAGAMRRLGKILCAAGDVSGGVEMLDRALGLYADLPNEDRNRMAQAEVLLELGAAHMCPVSGLQLARRAIASEGGEGGCEEAMEAFGCYKRCSAMLEFVPEARRSHGFKSRLLARFADCFVVLGDPEKANQHYERALEVLTDEDAAGLVEDHAHILSMLAIGRILSGRPSKALAVLETAYILLFHRSMDELSGRALKSGQQDSRYLVAALLALCYGCTDQSHKALSWGTRALAFFEGQYGSDLGRLQHSEDAWLLSQLLLSLGSGRADAGDLDESAVMLERALQVCATHLPKEDFLPCAALKALAEVRTQQGRSDEALHLFTLGATRMRELQDPHRFEESFQRAVLLQGVAVPREKPQKVLHDDLVAATVALQFKMAVEALQQRNHTQAAQLLSKATDFYREAHGTLQPEMVPVVGQLALSLHASLLTRPDQVEAEQVDTAFRTSISIEFYPSLALKYAVFLWQQGRAQEAMNICETVLFNRPHAFTVVYEGHEEATLPAMLLRELEGSEEDCVEFPALGFSLFVLYLAYKRSNFSALMDDVNAWLWSLAARGSCPMTCSLCAYILMDNGMFREAASAFMKAGILQGWARQVTRENLAVCMLCQFGPALRMQALAAALLRFAPTANCH